MTKYARMSAEDVNGIRMALEVIVLDGGQTPADIFHPDIAAQFIQAPNATLPGSTKQGATWTHPDPPEPVEPVEPELPAPAYYLPKVTWEARLSNEAFAALDAVRINVRNRPADWATSEDEAVVALRPFVRPVLAYEAAERVNVTDTRFALTLAAIQQQTGAFGDTPEEANDEIARVLTPGRLEGEPVA